MSDWDHIGKAVECLFSTITYLMITLCVVSIISLPLAIWKMADIILYLVRL